MTSQPCAWAFVVFLAWSGSVCAWGYQGHEVIGSIADQLLGAHAKQQVAEILGFELRVAGPWADCVKSVHRLCDFESRCEDDASTESGEHHPFQYSYLLDPNHPEYRIPCTPFENSQETARMQDYAKRNWSSCTPLPCNQQYHYAEVAKQHDGYDSSYAGTSDHDIVSAVNAAVLVLTNPTAKSPPPFSIHDQKEALLLLAHFVGDLHQPLHVGAIYLDPSGIPANPDLNTQKDTATGTEGGNAICINPAANLHYEWDAIPSDLHLDQEFRADAALVQRAQAVLPTLGEPEAFAKLWASDTVVASHSAFDDLTFKALTPPKGSSVKCFNHSNPKSLWIVSFKDQDSYLKAQDNLKRDQIAKAGARLAQLLNAIWP